MSDLTRPLPPMVQPMPLPAPKTAAAKLQALKDRAARATELHGLIESLSKLDCSALGLAHWNTGTVSEGVLGRDVQKQVIDAGVKATIAKCRNELDYLLGD